MSSVNSCEQYDDCNVITGADLHTGTEVYSISSYEEKTDADDYLCCEGSGSSSSPPDLERFCSLSSYEEGTDADDNFVCETSGLSFCPELESFCSNVQSNSDSDKGSQKKRAFSKVTLTRDRKRLKPIDGEVECLLLDGELVSEEALPPCFGDSNNAVII